QSFVPGRTAAATDVAIDSAGALLGLALQQALGGRALLVGTGTVDSVARRRVYPGRPARSTARRGQRTTTTAGEEVRRGAIGARAARIPDAAVPKGVGRLSGGAQRYPRGRPARREDPGIDQHRSVRHGGRRGRHAHPLWARVPGRGDASGDPPGDPALSGRRDGLFARLSRPGLGARGARSAGRPRLARVGCPLEPRCPARSAGSCHRAWWRCSLATTCTTRPTACSYCSRWTRTATRARP